MCVCVSVLAGISNGVSNSVCWCLQVLGLEYSDATLKDANVVPPKANVPPVAPSFQGYQYPEEVGM
jgi:hypothetical protein